MAMFHFNLVAPDKLLFSGEVDQVDIPGMDGDFGVLADHAPLVALLRPGVLTVRVGSDAQRLVIFGGFAEVSPQGLTVLADYATSLEDLDLAMLAARIAETEDKIKHIEVGSLLDRELERLDHFKAVGTHLQSTGMH
ncbi:MAG TPA: F0F1 ATP synthase subunit epsilon [Xanthobacteraceae bacterium]|jgi:F-type H+-transporting ATPase subunit epsilon|nr:F0F1 ATP synthase subunit epsilon [Xanthobacteraceae bacterium]